jgi:hypothetical protein
MFVVQPKSNGIIDAINSLDVPPRQFWKLRLIRRVKARECSRLALQQLDDFLNIDPDRTYRLYLHLDELNWLTEI